MGMEKTWFVKCYFYFKDFDKHKVEFELFVFFSLFSTYIFNLEPSLFPFPIIKKANYMKQGFS